MNKKYTIAVDFDSVLSKYYKFVGPFKLGDPIPGAKEFLQKLHDANYRIVVFSCRVKNEQLRGAVEAWLDKHEMIYESVFIEGHKPEAIAYFDDRAISLEPQRYGEKSFDIALTKLEELVEYKKQEKLHI